MLESDKYYGERGKRIGSVGERVEILNRMIRKDYIKRVFFK